MSKRKPTAREAAILSCLLIATIGEGCTRRSGLWPAVSPRTDGRWTGHVCRVTVFDVKGRPYEAAALQVESGPEPGLVLDPKKEGVTEIRGGSPPRPIPVELGGGRCPVLARPADAFPRMWPVDDLDPGERITIRGTMMMSTLPGPEGWKVSRTPRRPEEIDTKAPDIRAEHVLVVRGRPKHVK
jgi:hypothetical protein